MRHASVSARAPFMKSLPVAPKSAKFRLAHRYGGAALTLLAVAIAGFAAVRWANLLGSEPQAIATTSDVHAWSQLGRALRANSEVPFAAHVETVVFVGRRSLQSEARIIRAPGQMAITYLSGPMKGAEPRREPTTILASGRARPARALRPNCGFAPPKSPLAVSS